MSEVLNLQNLATEDADTDLKPGSSCPAPTSVPCSARSVGR